MSQQNWQLPPDFDILNAADATCDCGHPYFETVISLKRVPAEASPTKQDAVIPIPMFKCASCGKVHRDNSELS